MEAVGLAASVITIVNLTAVCLKSSSKLVGPSSYKPERLQSLYATLYGFNGTVRNLQTHLEIYEDDQSRLDTLDRLQEPLKRCREALQLLSSRLKSDGFFAQYVMGSRFDKKLDLCLRVLNDTKGLLELSLQSDQRIIVDAIERYTRILAEDTRDIKNILGQNEQQLQAIDASIKESTNLALRYRHDQVRSVARLECAIGNVQTDIESQTAQESSRERRKLGRHRSEVLFWLSDVNFRSNYQDASRVREAGTGQWLIDQDLFKSWRDSSVRKLWLHGMPGAGKTFLSTAVIDHLERTSTCPITFFYFDFRDAIKQATEPMIRSIAVQLETSSFADRLSPALEHLYSECQRTGSGRQPTLDEVTKLIAKLQEYVPKFYIVLDALDECQDRDKLLEAIATLTESVVKAKLVVTSRREQDIIQNLTEIDFTSISILEDASKRDIEIYVNSVLINDIYLRRLPEDSKCLIQKTLIDGAKSMFRWVKCQIDAIRLLKRPKAIKEALKSLPKTLDETYERILLHLSKETDDNIKLLRRILILVTFAERPMTLAELAQAIVVEPGDEKFDEDAAFHDPKALLSLCHPLIDVSPSTGLLGFVHYSVQEFLLSNRLPNAEGVIKTFALYEQTCHIDIARLCLTFLCYEDFADGPCPTFERFQKRTNDYPFLEYAANCWTAHARYEDDEAALSDLMLKLFVPQKSLRLGSALQAYKRRRLLCCGVANPDFQAYALGKFISSNFEEAKTNSLAVAAFFGFNTLLEDIVNSGADIDAPGTIVGNALQSAICEGHMNAVKTLISLGANINCPARGMKGSALEVAILYNQRAIIDLLLELNVDVMVAVGAFDTPLHCAIRKDDVATMEQLIVRGADVDYGKQKRNADDPNLPLATAAHFASPKAFLYLIASGASLWDHPIDWWANMIAENSIEGVSKEWALSFAEDLAQLGHHVEVVNIPEEEQMQESTEDEDFDDEDSDWRPPILSFRFEKKAQELRIRRGSDRGGVTGGRKRRRKG